MKTVTLAVSSLDAVQARLAAAFNDGPQGQRISFASIELLWKVISPKRGKLSAPWQGKALWRSRK